MSDSMNPGGGDPYPFKSLTGRVIGACFTVQRQFGYGFLESVYRRAVAVELRYLGIPVQQEVPYELFHRGVSVGLYRADLVVDSQVLIETKTGPALPPGSQAQLLNCLNAARLELGLLIYFSPKGATVKRTVASKHRSKQSTPDHL